MITEEQKRIQEAAAYGLPQNAGLPANYTHEQIEFLRGLIFQHDAQNAAMTREFDLNKPPTPPYRYQEYPRLVYQGTKTAPAADEFDLENLLTSGWSLTPPENLEVNLGGELSPAMLAEVQAVDIEARRQAENKPGYRDLERELAKLQAENEALKQKRK